MEDRTLARRASKVRRDKRLGLAIVSRWIGAGRRVDTPIPAPERLGLTFWVSAWVLAAVASGYAKLAVLAAQSRWTSKVTIASLSRSAHEGWTVPVAEAATVCALGLLSAPLLLLVPRRRRAAAAVGLLGAAGTFGPLAALRGVHLAAVALLAAGIGVRLASGRKRTGRPGLAARLPWAAVLAGGFLLMHALGHHNAIARTEETHWARPTLPPEGTPSLLWIVMDTVRADHMSVYGYGRPTTPHLERWAKRGIVFTQARATAPWTLPSHMSMFTGLWPDEHDVSLDAPYEGDHPLISEHLFSAGFATAGIVANVGCCNASFGFGRGFSHYLDHRERYSVTPKAVATSSTVGQWLVKWSRQARGRDSAGAETSTRSAQDVTTLARNWLDEQQAAKVERPFFLFLNFMDAHEPYHPPEDYERRFWTAPLPTDPRAFSSLHGADAWRAYLNATPESRPDAEAKLGQAVGMMTDLYDDCLGYLDQELGLLLDGLEREGRLDNTWVVITSDHGEHFGEHGGEFAHGTTLYDELVHVPLIVIPPLALEASTPAARARGSEISELVSLRSLPATLTPLLLPGQEHPYPGQSLEPLWSTASVRPANREPALAQVEARAFHEEGAASGDRIARMEAAFDQEHVIIRRQPQEGSGVVEELYRYRSDPAQAENRVFDADEQEARRKLGKWLDGKLSPTDEAVGH